MIQKQIEQAIEKVHRASKRDERPVGEGEVIGGAGDTDDAIASSDVAQSESSSESSSEEAVGDRLCGDPEGTSKAASQGWKVAPSNSGGVGALMQRLVASIGPLLVLLGFAALFYFGHEHDWRIAKFATLIGTANPVRDDWCTDHAVPASICVECNPELMPRNQDFGWCNEHGVHNCVLDHPELAELKQPPATQSLQVDRRRAEAALAAGRRRENNSRCTLYQNRIQFASVDSVRQAGVDIGLVERGVIVESIEGNGEIVYDPTRKASISSRVPGSVWSVEKNIGDRVQQGELLALIDATTVGAFKSDLLRALAEEALQRKNVSRLREAQAAVAGARILEAEAALAKARADVLNAEQAIRNLGLPVDAAKLRGLTEDQVLNALRFLGVPPSVHATIPPALATANLLPVLAPMDGTVIHRSVSLGEVVDPSQELFEIADTRRMWLKLSLPLESIDSLAIGQTIRFTPDGSDHRIEGQLEWISTGADQHTRMVDVRAVLENPDGRLRDRTFGTGRVILRDVPDAIVVPSEATHWEGCCQIVFVRDKDYFASPDSPKVFHIRSVRLGATHGGRSEVIAGLLPGEVIAVEGSDVLRAQLLKNGLGAGCCIEE